MSILEELQAKAAEQASAAADNSAENQEAPQEENTADAPESEKPADEPAAETKDTHNEPNQPEQSAGNDTQEKAETDGNKIFANEELAEANAYLARNPEKTLADYNALKNSTSTIGEEELLRKYLSEKENKTPSEIAYELKRFEEKKREEDDDFGDFGDPDDLETLKLKAEKERLLQSAREWHEGYVKSQLGENEDKQADQNEHEETVNDFIARMQKVQEQQVADYRTTIYSALPEIQEVVLKVNGEEVLFTPDEEFRAEMRATSEDVTSVTKKFFDESGKVKDPKGFITEAALWVNPKTRQKMIDFMIDQAVARDRATQDKQRRNINLDNYAPSTVTGAASGADTLERFRQDQRKTTF